jgi:signal transduction histidine kinase
MSFLRSALDDLQTFAGAVRAMANETGAQQPSEMRLRLLDMLAESDVDYLIARMPGAVDRVVEGLSRVSSIVRAMKDFSHLDQREKLPSDLNEAVEKTLVITRGEYKHIAEIQKDLGDLPRVKCHVGDVQQVLVNLLINAAHAVEIRVDEVGHRGMIAIRSYLEDEAATEKSPAKTFAVISIRDNGGGIPKHVADRVFEPFFTTKEPGRGTGQGLSISRSIIEERHDGTLRFTSEPGQGTTFFVRLPV